MSAFSPEQLAKITGFAQALVDQDGAQLLVDPLERKPGFWFGGGNMVEQNGAFYIVGRYRNEGDSGTDVGAGERGLELAVFWSEDFYGPYEKVLSFSKADLQVEGAATVSIGGSALHLGEDGTVELFVSTERDIPYPDSVLAYQKPGTGVWSISRMTAPTIEALSKDSLELILSSAEPSRLHWKDPNVFETGAGTLLGFCNHPHSWACSNSSFALRPKGERDFQIVTHQALERGPVWDVAVTRVTDMVGLPRVGVFSNGPIAALHFYDGAECMCQLDDNPMAVNRPRGFSCEEIGGLAYALPMEFPTLHRITIDAPLLTSPHGTGCSRYVSTLKTDDAVYATWQQSQPDGSQPLMGHRLTMEQVERLLS